MNNAASNLKWMTPQQNNTHQQSSPHVIKQKHARFAKNKDTPHGAKLTIGKVGELKKLLQHGETVKSMAKKFKITGTQILRIKRGEHWSHVRPDK